MNAFLKKEIRLLLPSWIVAVLLALPTICTRSDDGVPVFLLFLGMAMMALTSIGRETSLNTFSLLLAQPAERTQIWKTKLSVLIAALFVVFSVWRLAMLFSFHDYEGSPADPEAAAAVLAAGYLVLVAAFTGGLWATLLLRQIAGAFWLTLLVPATLAGFTAAFLAEKHSSDTVIAALCVIIAIYSVGGFLFARWLFFRAQDVGWTGGIIALPEWKFFSAISNAADSPRKWQPIFALLKKEFQLQQVSLFGATGLLVLHIGVIVLRTHHKFARESGGEILTSIFWMLWLVLPVMVGTMAVAEERRLGVMEGQLCLPVSRRVQFIIKGFLALFLGTFLGGVLPMFLETVTQNQVFRSAEHPGAFEMISMQFFIAALAAWLALVSFFASSIARNFLQSVGFSIATFVGTVLLGSALIDGRMFFLDSIPAHSVLPVVIAVPTAIVTLLWLAYLNFKNFRDGWPLWRRNLLGWVGALAFIVVMSAVLYNRAWEVFEPAEPAHGTAKFSLANHPVLRTDAYDNLLVRLPDGRVWFDYLRYNVRATDSSRLKWLWRYLVDPLPRSAGVKLFVADSDWSSATEKRVDFFPNGSSQPSNHIVGYLDTVGVKTDGTLWISDVSKTGAWTGDKMNRFGIETNWQQIVRARYEVLLLKNDGTLWCWSWGTNNFNSGIWQTNWPSLHNYQPHQIGTDSNWREIYDGRWVNLARKSDGSVWQVGYAKTKEDELRRETNLDQVSFQTLSLSSSGARAYVRPDGTLWMSWKYEESHTNTVYSDFVKVGTETNWADVALSWGNMVALKSDGSLWRWQFKRLWNDTLTNLTQSAQKPPTRLGIHNDWVAIATTWEDMIALAADGSLWLWPNREGYEYEQTLLKLPKQPQPLSNVFNKPD